MGNTAYEILNKSIVVCTVTDNPQVTVTIHPVLAVSAAFLRLSMKGFQHNCEPSQGSRGLLVPAFGGNAGISSPSSASSLLWSFYKGQICHHHPVAKQNHQRLHVWWLKHSDLSLSFQQRYLLAPQREAQSTKRIPAQGRWCWQTEKETLGIAFKCFLIKGICHAILRHCQCASQHGALLRSYLNVLLAVHSTIGDGLHAGRQSYGAESSALLKNKQSSYDLQNSRLPKIQAHQVLLWFLLPALHVFSWKCFIPCLKVSRVKGGHSP